MANSISFPTIPAFYTDPNFQTAQSTLMGFGNNMLNGNIPSYYSMIGDVGGPAFEDVMKMKNRDIQQNVLEGAAKMGTPSGAAASAIAKATADSSTQLRWNNVLQAIQGRQSLLGSGLNALQGVDSAALSYGGQKNQYDMQGAQLETERAISEAKLTAEINAQKKMAQQQMWSSIIGGVAGGATNIYGMNMLSGIMKGGGSAVTTAAGAGGGLATDPFSGGMGDIGFFSNRLSGQYQGGTY